MADPTVALHTALIAALDGACSCDVWDTVPQNAAYPYVVTDYQYSDNEDFVAQRFDRRTCYLSIWSDISQAEVMGIIGEIETLHEQPLTLTTGTCVSLRVDSKRTFREPDALTFRGQVILRIYTSHS
jgi:hypothetical protein